MFLTASFTYAQQTLIADAGADSIFCQFQPDSFKLGGTPVATGGNGHYSYKWDIYPKPFIPFPLAPQINYYCSEFLDDTTSANPRLLWLPSEETWLTFVLTVTDDSGQVAIDSVSYLQITWMFALGNIMITTFPGDTQTITPGGFSGGIPPYTIDWGSDSLIGGGRYDYNVYFDTPVSRRVIIPNATSPLWYSVWVTDSVGCSTGVGTWEQFIILPSSVENHNQSNVDVFPNPVQDCLNVKLPQEHLVRVMLYDLVGRIIYEQKPDYYTEFVSINFSEFLNGVYYLIVETDNGTVTRKVLKSN